MKRVLMLLGYLAAVSCTFEPPSTRGINFYNARNYAAAYDALVPLADRRDPAALYYLGLMSLEGNIASPLTDSEIRANLVSASGKGHNAALALLLYLAMTPQERAQIAVMSQAEKEANAKRSAELIRKLMEGIIPPSDLETLIGGPDLGQLPMPAGFLTPVDQRVLRSISETHAEAQNWPRIPQFVIPVGTYVTIDMARAKHGYKNAQLRLGKRYRDGAGVERNMDKAIRSLKRAVKYITASPTCVYISPVGDAKYGSTQCFESGLPDVPGLAEAGAALCGIHTDFPETYPRLQKYC